MKGRTVVKHIQVKKQLDLQQNQLLLNGISYAKFKNIRYNQQQQEDQLQKQQEKENKIVQQIPNQINELQQTTKNDSFDSFDINFSVNSLDDYGNVKQIEENDLTVKVSNNKDNDELDQLDEKNYIQINKDNIKDLEKINEQKKKFQENEEKKQKQKLEKIKQQKIQEKIQVQNKELNEHQFDHLNDYYQDQLTGNNADQLMKYLNLVTEQDISEQESEQEDSNKNKFQPTQIEEFNFCKKDYQNSLRIKKVQQMLDEKENAILKELDFKFKANPLPAHVKMAMFHEIHEKTKLKEKIKKEIPIEIKEKQKWLKFDQDSINERIKIRAKQTLSNTEISNYPRMVKSVKYKQKKDKYIENFMNTKDGQHLTLSEVPDFVQLQKNFTNQLQRIRINQQLTKFQPFNLTERIQSEKLDYLQEDQQIKKKYNNNNWKKILQKEYAVDTILTNNQTFYMDHNKRLKEKEQLQQQQEQEMKIKRQQNRYKQQVQEKLVFDDNKKQREYDQKQKLMKMEDKQRKKDYQKQIQEMDERIQKRDYLFEQPISDYKLKLMEMEQIYQEVEGISKYQAKQQLSWKDYNLYLDYLEIKKNMKDRRGIQMMESQEL